MMMDMILESEESQNSRAKSVILEIHEVKPNLLTDQWVYWYYVDHARILPCIEDA